MTVGIGARAVGQGQTEQESGKLHESAQSIIDALSSRICVLDENGAIVAVNAAWRQFAGTNASTTAAEGDRPGTDPSSGLCEGANYLAVCDQTTGAVAQEAAGLATGICAIIAGTCAECSMEPATSDRDEGPLRQ
jgi:hypothetical protein